MGLASSKCRPSLPTPSVGVRFQGPRRVTFGLLALLAFVVVNPASAQQTLSGEVKARNNRPLRVGRLSGGPTPPPTTPNNDIDHDGLTNAFEEAGWDIVIDHAGYGPIALGSLVTIKTVTSDPRLADTDGDGLDDKVEFLIGTDPRAADTDGDGLTDEREWNKWFSNPSTVDSDADSRGPDHDLTPDGFLFDGQELATDTHVTSPTLDDTDGDGRTDAEELYHPFFHPLIAELPRADIVIAGDLDIRLDVEYAESVGVETSYEVSLSNSTTSTTGGSSSMGTSESSSSSYTAGVHSEATLTATWESSVSGEYSAGLPPGGSVTASQSVGGSVSGTLGASFDTTVASEVVQETVFTSSFESSASSGQTHSNYESDTSNLTEMTAGGSITLPIQILNEGLITYKVTNLGITLLKYERPPFGGTGTFKAMGTIVPDIPEATLAPGEASTIFKLESEDLNADVIKDFMAAPGTLVLQPASFDLLDSNGIDFNFITENAFTQTAMVEIDYGGGIFEFYRVATNVDRDGGTYNGIKMGDVLQNVLGLDYTVKPVEVDISGTGTMVPLMGVDPEGKSVPIKILTMVEGKATNEVIGTNQVWVNVLSEGDFSDAITADVMTREGVVTYVDFNSIRLKGGDTIRLIYTEDLDGDGLWAAEEAIYGSVDSPAMAGGPNPDSFDFDKDMLNDMQEAKEGWNYTNPVDGLTYRVYSDPRTKDTDFDGSDDLDEKNNGTNPRHPDSDFDGIQDGLDPSPLVQARRLYVWSGEGPAPSPTSPFSVNVSGADAFGTPGSPGGGSGSIDIPGHGLRDAFNYANSEFFAGRPVAEIWVARGDYKKFITDNELIFPHGNVKVYGGFDVNDSKFGQRDPDPFTNGTQIVASALTFANWNQSFWPHDELTPSGTLDGFVLAGYASPVTGARPQIGVASGGLITLRNLLVANYKGQVSWSALMAYSNLNQPKASLRVESCTFTQNENQGRGGAITDFSHRPIYKDCLFFANRTGNSPFWSYDPDGQGGHYSGGGAYWRGTPDEANPIAGQTPQQVMYDEQPLFVGCVFQANQVVTPSLIGGAGGLQMGGGGGAVNLSTGGGEFVDCEFVSNRAATTSVHPDFGPVVGSSLAAGDGGAIFWDMRGFMDGGSLGSGALHSWPLTVVNCRFYNNTAGRGSAVWVDSYDDTLDPASIGTPGTTFDIWARFLNITNCSFAGNHALYRDASEPSGLIQGLGGPSEFYFGSDNLSMQNSVSWGNFGNGHVVEMDMSALERDRANLGPLANHTATLENGAPFVRVMDVEFNLFGGDLFSYPLFLFYNSPTTMDPFSSIATGDLRPMPGGLGVDTGIDFADTDALMPGLQLLPPTDLDGNGRFVNGDGLPGAQVDMGAYELQSP